MNTWHSQAPYPQGQKLDKNKGDMCSPLEVNTSKCLGSSGDWALPVYIMARTLVTCWKPMAVDLFVRRVKR